MEFESNPSCMLVWCVDGARVVNLMLDATVGAIFLLLAPKNARLVGPPADPGLVGHTTAPRARARCRFATEAALRRINEAP
jgi:hypothetical protein